MKYFGFEQLCSSFPLPIYYDRATDLIYNLIKRLYSLSYIIYLLYPPGIFSCPTYTALKSRT